MVLIDYPNMPPPNSNQTPIAFEGIPQHITTWYPHRGIAVDNYEGVPQHITTSITPGAGPDTYAQQYGKKKMSLGINGSSLLIGLIGGFIVGGIVFTATGRGMAGAVGRRATAYIEPSGKLEKAAREAAEKAAAAAKTAGSYSSYYLKPY